MHSQSSEMRCLREALHDKPEWNHSISNAIKYRVLFLERAKKLCGSGNFDSVPFQAL